ncbi:Hypothetical predicted protein [Mytilus galloprovincialis]|uniref:Uncharacterized protein n=1 Tax=Mytilus galloprovincialis TaxID=29158 RepID=A0A8B6E019_MYTGA|nr:Hypothetical predicted protein [Mytilus galloprovincialis]
MSMWKFVTKKRSPDDIVLRLPNPDNATNKDAADKIKAANTEIVNSLATDESTTSTKRGVKRKASNNHYTPETRAKIAKYATEHGNVAAARKFSKDLQLDIIESAVRAMKARIQHVFVPAGCTGCTGCTGELQPMDLSVNGELKAAMKNEFTNWYADMVAEDLKDSSTINKVDLRLSVLKPLHAKWLSKVFHDLKSKKDIILLGWKKSGISDCIKC